jgi:hypothetical protein
MKIVHLGSFSSQHTQMAAIAYKAIGYEAIFVNTKKDCYLIEIPGLDFDCLTINPYVEKSTFRNARWLPQTLFEYLISIVRYLGFYDKKLETHLSRIKSENKIDLIVSTWGFPVLEATLLSQKIFKDSIFVHNILTIPDLPFMEVGINGIFWSGFKKIFDIFQDKAYEKMLKGCHIRIHASGNMLKYVKGKYKITGNGIDEVRLERFNSCYFPTERINNLSNFNGGPNVVHLGATNFATGLSIDDVSDALNALAECKIHTHFYAKVIPPQLKKSNKNYHGLFEKFNNQFDKSAFSNFLTQFDAIIILYNVKQCYDRFKNALPTRFLFGLVIGIPIVLPRNLFPACEEYVNKYQIGFAYENEQDLYEKLINKDFMSIFKTNALLHSENLSFESNMADYKETITKAFEIKLIKQLK